jgi:CRISPR/Cas system CSM-associated protein Csm4 (group 5 of RAMP superfamily)
MNLKEYLNKLDEAGIPTNVEFIKKMLLNYLKSEVDDLEHDGESARGPKVLINKTKSVNTVGELKTILDKIGFKTFKELKDWYDQFKDN